MEPGLCTHFGYRFELEPLHWVRAHGVRWARIDAMTCDAETRLGMIDDCLACDLQPLVIVQTLAQLATVPPGVAVEWTNEPDGDFWPSVYRQQFDAACALAARRGSPIYGPAISNLDWNSLAWLDRLRDVGHGWPAGLTGISAHRYGDGTFTYAHPPFTARVQEVEALIAVCDGLPFLITEVGYPCLDGLTEAHQAAYLTAEWLFWAQWAMPCGPFIFQINDGPTETREHRYGLRRCAPDGTLGDWKPAAYTFPQPQTPQGETTMAAETVILDECIIPLDGRPGQYSAYTRPGADTVIGVDQHGTIYANPVANIGQAFETFRKNDTGDVAIFEETGSPLPIGISIQKAVR